MAILILMERHKILSCIRINSLNLYPMRLKLLFICIIFSFVVPAQKQQKFFDAGMKLISEEKYELAIGELKNAIAANPKFAESYYQRGRCYLNLGKNADAKKDLDKAIEL